MGGRAVGDGGHSLWHFNHLTTLWFAVNMQIAWRATKQDEQRTQTAAKAKAKAPLATETQ